ncbi:MAG: DUF1810 domain-containing protein [Armatimonadota bacterium]
MDLQRFVEAQEGVYEESLAEITAGNKRSHWMWFIFPQEAGLGRSAMSERYAIQTPEEADAFLAHPILGPRLVTISRALLQHRGRTLTEILGTPDDVKLLSCARLFSEVRKSDPVFEELLRAFSNPGGGGGEFRK